MRIILALAALLVLSGCESMDFTSVTVSSGYSHYYPSNHISYSLGFYTGHYYNGYRVYGNHGHRYYHAPRYYSHHRHFARPPVVHHHVHTSYCEHNYRPRNHHRQDRNNHRQAYVQPQVRNTPRRAPRSTPSRHRNQPRHVQPQIRNRNVDRNENRRNNVERRENRQDRSGQRERKRH